MSPCKTRGNSSNGHFTEVFTCCQLHTLCNNYFVTKNHQEKVLKLTRKLGVLRPRDLKASGVQRLISNNWLSAAICLKTGRGLYVQTGAPMTENHSLAEAAKTVAERSDLSHIRPAFSWSYHGDPAEVWMAIPRGTRPPKPPPRPLRVVTLSGEMMTEGVNGHVSGVSVPVYCVSKTVADCFRFRNRIGVNSRSRRSAMRGGERKPLPGKLWHYAKVCRVLNVMRPISTASHEKPCRFSPCPPGKTPDQHR